MKNREIFHVFMFKMLLYYFYIICMKSFMLRDIYHMLFWQIFRPYFSMSTSVSVAQCKKHCCLWNQHQRIKPGKKKKTFLKKRTFLKVFTFCSNFIQFKVTLQTSYNIMSHIKIPFICKRIQHKVPNRMCSFVWSKKWHVMK